MGKERRGVVYDEKVNVGVSSMSTQIESNQNNLSKWVHLNHR